MINERPASSDESRALAEHLQGDRNARAYGIQLRAGLLRAFTAPIPERPALGAISTCLAVLGSGSGARHALTLTGHPNFLVRDAYVKWRHSLGDERSFALLEEYVLAARNGEIHNGTLTLAPDALGLRLVDGNKRAIALFEADRSTSYPIRVFILRTP